jgi:HK97 family phage portal protein
MKLPDIFGVRKLSDQVSQLNNIIALQEKAATPIAMQFRNFNTQIFPHYNIIKEELIYQIMDDIYSVVSRLATTAAGLELTTEDTKGNELPPKDKLNIFLNTLSFEQKEIFYTTLFLQGEIFAYKEKIDFGVNAGVQRLVPLVPSMMVVIISDTYPTEIVGYRLYDSIRGYTKDFDVDEIMYVKTFNPTSDLQKRFRGFAATTALKQRLTRVQSELDVSIAQMQNGGVPGVMYEKMPMSPAAMGQRQDNFTRFLNNSANKGAPYMVNGEIGYFAIGSALADMQLAELANLDFSKICNAFSVSSIMFNNHDASRNSNMKEVIKLFYTNAILPQVKRLVGGLNMQVLPDIQTTGISEISELQDDLKITADALLAAPVMRPNDVIEKMGGQKTDDPLMDKWYIKSGYTPIEDMQAPDVIPNAAGDYMPPVVPPKEPAK